MLMLRCHICNEAVKRHEYTSHVASHLVGNATSVDQGSFGVFRNDSSKYDHPAPALPAHSTSRRSRAPDPQEHVEKRYQETPEEQSKPLNAFQIWRQNYTSNAPQYTVIDGAKSESDSKVREAAKVLRATTKEAVMKTVESFKGFSSNGERNTCLELVRKVPIFPGLVAYIYTHLIMCPRRGWIYKEDWADRVSELERLVECWANYEDAWCIIGCDALKDVLLKILHATKVGPGEHKCNSALLNDAMVMEHDILNLASLAVLCITGPQRQEVLGVGEIRKLIDLFHGLLESNVELDECYRRCFLNILIPFSKSSGCCPSGFYITDGTISELEWKSEGAFGQVSKGRLDSRVVALKALKRGTKSWSDYAKLLTEEASVWWYLSHPNCLPLYGVYVMPWEGQDMRLGLVSPWMAQGTLSGYLKRNPSANRTKLILDVVRGLKYLHTLEPHVAHRDIKPENILVTNTGRACLADFGLASVFDTANDLHTTASNVCIAGTFPYMAPEMEEARTKEKLRRVNKRACDMYALGCTIYEIYTGKRFAIFSQSPEFHVDKISPDMWSFVESLCDEEPLKRLTAQMALDWMEVKASQEGIDLSLPLGEEEWERKRDTSNFWSVPL